MLKKPINVVEHEVHQHFPGLVPQDRRDSLESKPRPSGGVDEYQREGTPNERENVGDQFFEFPSKRVQLEVGDVADGSLKGLERRTILLDEETSDLRTLPDLLEPVPHLPELVDSDHEGSILEHFVIRPPWSGESIDVHEPRMCSPDDVGDSLQIVLEEEVLEVGLLPPLVILDAFHDLSPHSVQLLGSDSRGHLPEFFPSSSCLFRPTA